MSRPALPLSDLDNPLRRRTLITLAAWTTLGAGLSSGCGGGGSDNGQNNANNPNSSGSTGDAQTASARLQAAASAVPLLSFLAGNVTGVTLTLPTAIAVANDGTAYVVDKSRHVVIAIAPDGVAQILAGYDGDAGNGEGFGATFAYPQGVAVSSKGVVYVADTDNHTIRRIDGPNTATTIAGSAGRPGSGESGDGQGFFQYPCGLAMDASDNLYVADCHNHTIRRIAADGRVSTLAGWAGVPGSEDGNGQAARFKLPYAVAVDTKGNVYVADSGNHTIRVIDAKGTVRTLAGLAGSPGAADGKGTVARFDGPRGIQVDADGVVYVTDRDNQAVRQITAGGVVSTWAGTPGKEGLQDGAAKDATFSLPCGLARDSKGALMLTELGHQAVRKIDAAGKVSTLISAATGQEGVGATVRFSSPHQVALDKAGVTYVADSGHHSIRKVLPDGTSSTLAGTGNYNSVDGTGASAGFSFPLGVAVDDSGTVYVADTYSHTIRKVTPAGVVSTLAGTAYTFGSTDGTGAAARFYFPTNLAVDDAGNVYVADSSNATIRKVTPAGVVTTLAGKAGAYGYLDGAGTEARFYAPAGIAVDGQGNIYVGDSGNQVIRKITPAGVVSTHAGQAGTYGYVDGPAASARFASPWRIAADSAGQVYVADAGSRTLRQISTSGVVSTLAGSTLSGFHGGTLPGSFDNCSGLAVRDGRLVFSTREGLAQISPLS